MQPLSFPDSQDSLGTSRAQNTVFSSKGKPTRILKITCFVSKVSANLTQEKILAQLYSTIKLRTTKQDQTQAIRNPITFK